MPGDLSEVGNGQFGQRQRSVQGRHVGEAHAQSSVPVRRIFLHPQKNPLLDSHWAAAEHQAAPERVLHPLCESTPMAQADLFSHSLAVEGQMAEAKQAATV